MSDLINPNNYGMLPTGFSRMRFPEIRQQIIDTLTASTGLVFETRPDSITGQFIDTFAEREATLWEIAEAVYNAMYPISAFGVSLDYSVSFSGVRRLFAQHSSVWCACFGVEGTIIPPGSIVRSNTNQDNFLLDNTVTISRQQTSDITLAPNDAIVGSVYWVQVNGITYSYTAVTDDTILTIAQQLFIQLQATHLVVVLNANLVRLYTIESDFFITQISTNMTITLLGSPGHFTAELTGAVSVAAHTVNQIVSNLAGWDSVDNNVAGALGVALETDDELRLRYNRGVFRLGAGSVDAIRANLQQNIPGILNVEVYENTTNATDSDGRLPHSIEVIAQGGDTNAIANEIWRTKPAGIDTNGATVVAVIDSQGQTHDIHFNRPQIIYVWVKVSVSLYDEEIFHDNGVLQIQTIIQDTGNNFGIGKDIILQRFMGPVYSQVPGIASLAISVATNTDPTYTPVAGDYQTNNVPIGSGQLSQFFYANVFIDVPLPRTDQ